MMTGPEITVFGPMVGAFPDLNRPVRNSGMTAGGTYRPQEVFKKTLVQFEQIPRVDRILPVFSGDSTDACTGFYHG